MPRLTIADKVYSLLLERRAATADELAGPVLAAGLTRARSPVQAVSGALGRDFRFRRLEDGRWIVPALLLDGATLTHRPTPDELASGALALDPDLAPLSSFGLYSLRTLDDATLAPLWNGRARELTGLDTDLAIQGPPGWLGSPAEQSLLHVHLVQGSIAVSWEPEPAASTRMRGRMIAESIRRALDAQPRDGALWGFPPSVSLRDALLGMLVDDPELLHEPMMPLGSLLQASDLEVHRGWVGYPGTDWQALDEFMDDDDLLDDADIDFDVDFDWDDGDDADTGAINDRWLDDEGVPDDEAALDELLEQQYGLPPQSVKEFKLLMGAYAVYRQDRAVEGAAMQRVLGSILADDRIAAIMTNIADSDSDLEPFVAAIEQHASAGEVAGARYVLAACAEARDDLAGAERWLRAALDADARFAPAAIELARLETDRASYGEALRLLITAGVPADDPERAWLEDVARSAFPKVGRNDRCPCGSGRKYKACHLGREADAGSVSAASALLHKLWLWLDRPRERRAIDELLRETVPASADRDRDDTERQRIDGQFIDDVLLFDRGRLERFVHLHTSLLPPGELELARSWLPSQRSLYEARSVRAGKSLLLHDLVRGGPDVVLADGSMARQVERLDVLCLRLVPDGSGGFVAAAALLVPRPQRERATDIVRSGDPLQLLRWLARPTVLPQLANMEGEPLSLIEATYRVPDPAATAVALGRRLRSEGQGRFVEAVVHDGRDLMRGSIQLDGDIATLMTNSRQRAARLERTLMRAAPGARLIRRDERGMEEALAAYDPDAAAAGSAAARRLDPANHPELAAAMEGLMHEYEQRWVNDPIPALDGMTPREAMHDPRMATRLEALLDDMEWQSRRVPGGSTMDAGRVRALLGLSGRLPGDSSG